jgi:HicB family
MPAKPKKTIVSKFPLRLMPSVRQDAESFSEKEGVSLNQFINVAVAEKLAHLQHEKWLARRQKVTPARIAQAMAILNKPTGIEPAQEDRLPEGYAPLPR